MPTPSRLSSALFTGVLVFAMALVIWWTTALWQYGSALTSAAERLGRNDTAGVAEALGAEQGNLAAEGRRVRIMFLSEGLVFLLILGGAGILYRRALQRENRVRDLQDRFLTGATHELRTPLATVKLGLETLGRGDLPAERREHYLKSMLSEVSRLENGTRNLLAAAGLRSAGPPLQLAQGDLVEDVREAIEALQDRAVTRNQSVELVKAPASAGFSRDPEAVALVLRNLLDNALKYSPPGGAVRVEVRSEPGSSGGGARLTVDVLDTGRGLVGDEPRRVFEPYWRGADQAAGGAGLGLHVVRELVEAHGGEVDAISAGRDQGSCFRVCWPAGPCPDRAPAPAEPTVMAR